MEINEYPVLTNCHGDRSDICSQLAFSVSLQHADLSLGPEYTICHHHVADVLWVFAANGFSAKVVAL